MKNRTAILLAALLAPLTFSAAAATPEQSDCDLVRNAAFSGQTNAVNRISTLESTVKDQVVTSRTCMERFGDLAARMTVNLGGADVAPIRNQIFGSACSVIQGKLSQAQAQAASGLGTYGGTVVNGVVNGNLSQSVAQTAGKAAGTAVRDSVGNATIANASGNAIGATVNSASGSVWDRMTSMFSR
ncbi:hypothetical protein [Ramlibacter sp. AN1133]|uniref:hypothetical protein n=1 Tax=Ramlibacter sp. AN1133 TaxID=3133429 RepID=UPI0030C2EA88